MSTADWLSTIVQFAFGAALAIGARWIGLQVRVRRPAHRIWRHARSRPFHIVTAQDDEDFVSEYTVKVYPAEYLAAVTVRSLLVDGLGIDDVILETASEFVTARSISTNIVCVGGPVHNRITKLMLERIDVPVEFDGFDVVLRGGDARFSAEVDLSTNRIVRDVGVVIVAPNPFEKSACVVLLMGSRTFGCAAAASFMTQGNLRRVDETLGSGETRWAVLDVDVVDDFVARVSVLEGSGI